MDLTEAHRLLFCDEPAYPLNAAAPPIFQTSLFTFDSYQDMAAVYAGEQRLVYTRGDNPTVQVFEELVARLEGADAGRGFASGMAAITATVMAFVSGGDRLVTVCNVYGDAYKMFEKLLRPAGVTIDYVDGSDPEAVARALPGAKMLYVETPTTLTFELQHLPTLAALAQQHGVVTAIDNSWATPLYQNPIAHGIDLVIHAASKYLGGYSDTVAGVVVGRQDLIDRINGRTYPYLGAKLSPFDAFLLVRGLRSLTLRMPVHMSSGMTIARRLRDHPEVTSVLHPAFSSHPGRETLTGYGGVFSFLVSDAIDVPAFADALRLIRLGVSWGGPESLLVPLSVTAGMPPAPNPFVHFGISDRMIRLNVGLEPVDAIWSDLEQALEHAAKSGNRFSQ
ncbi:aminotransferase class I/II-fold pyridoxal phosphate-dependent enzyme [Insolitispirillum peregrinum]|uniref:aminotransferase class I/II-fold pyridoxal phosphate-dependent enzyme n=1 Tax=Insolitispirillum peregrinum TaxID=80876 RepID=UPI003618C1F7